MTRPRAHQINDLSTSYVPFRIPYFPTGNFAELSGPQYDSFIESTITGSISGREEAMPARIVCPSVEPFAAMSAGDQLGISMTGVNGGNVMQVTLQSADFVMINGVSSITASKLASRINSVLSSHGVTYAAASNKNGVFTVVSASGSSMSVGSDKSVTMTEITPWILQKLGFGSVSSVSSSGKDLSPGVVTESVDGLGGFVPLKYLDNSPVLTTTDYMVSIVQGTCVKSFPHIVGGQSVYARLTKTSTPSVVMSFMADLHSVPPIVSSGGDFCSLTAADTIRFHVSGKTFEGDSVDIISETNFNFQINDVNDVVDAINSDWHSASGSGNAIVVAAIPEPYMVRSTDSFSIKIDEHDPINVQFTATASVNAKFVVDAINSQWTLSGKPGVIAFVHEHDGSNYVKIMSQSVNGHSSSVKIGKDSMDDKETINKLGLSHGIIRGSDLVKVYGSSEISVVLPFTFVKNTNSNLSISIINQSGLARSKMGFGSSMIVFPDRYMVNTHPVSIKRDILTSDGIDTIIPELVEFGDVPSNEESVSHKFEKISSIHKIDSDVGFERSNRPVFFDCDGRLDKSVLSGFVADSINSKIVDIGSSNLQNPNEPRISVPFYYDGPVSSNLTTIQYSPGFPSNPLDPSHAVQSFRSYIGNDSDPSIAKTKLQITWNAVMDGSVWKKDRTGQVSSSMSFGYDGVFRIDTNNSGNDQWTNWSHSSVFTVDTSSPEYPVVLLRGYGKFSVPDRKFTMEDANTASGSEGVAYLSGDANGDQFIRVSNGDISANIPDYSIFQSLNARHTVTCGDGTSTFGDFNGPNALADAIEFIESMNQFGQASIFLKKGTYESQVNTSLDLSIIGVAATEGNYQSRIEINGHGVGDAIVINKSGDNGSLYLKNLDISCEDDSAFGVVSNNGAVVVAEDCIIRKLKFNNPKSNMYWQPCQGVFRRCRIDSDYDGDIPVVSIDNVSDGNKVIFEDCTFFAGGMNRRMVYIKAGNYITSSVKFDGLAFLRCKFLLSYATTSGGNLIGNSGLIDLHPGFRDGPTNDARQGRGLVIKNVIFEDCDVRVSNPESGTNILLHLLPTANGINAVMSSNPFTYIDTLVFNRTTFEHKPPEAGQPNAFTVAYGARKFVMRDCKYVLSSVDPSSAHGIPTNDVAYSIHGGLSNGGPSGDPADGWTLAATWGSIAIIADDVVIDGLEASGFLHLSSSLNVSPPWSEGDVFILYAKNLLVRNSKCEKYNSLATSSSVTPLYRWAFNNFGHPSMIDGTNPAQNGLIDGLVLNGTTPNNAFSWTSRGHVLLNAKGIHMTNSSITKFGDSIGDLGGTGVRVDVIGNEIWHSLWTASNFKITNCTLSELARGIYCEFNETVNGCGKFEISGNSISNCLYYGVWLDSKLLSGGGIISKNNISNCGSYGILYIYKESSSTLNVTDNILKNNQDSNSNNTQIVIHPFATGSLLIPDVFLIGNSVYYYHEHTMQHMHGHIGVTIVGNSGNEEGLPSHTPNNLFFGMETGRYSLTEYEYSTNSYMLRNRALLATPHSM